MSNLTVDTLVNQDVQLCKAWVNFNGTGVVAIRSAFNVSSITDNGVGSYTLNYTVAFLNANYSAVASAAAATDTANLNPSALVDRTTSSGRVDVEISGGGSQFDAEVIDALIFSN